MSQPPPNPPRPRALADLDALIARVEGEVEARRRAVQRLTAAREDSRVASGQLRVAEQRLARLRESRRVLLEGEEEVETRRRKPETTKRPHRRKTPDDTGGDG
jgi:hypothetical protein